MLRLTLILFFFLSLEAKAQPTVLLVNMWTETYNFAQSYELSNRIRESFKNQNQDPQILSVEVNKNERNPKRRIEQLFQKISLYAKYNVAITHIFFAGHGASKGETLVIGDIIFSPQTIGDLVHRFAPLRKILSPQVKVFLFACSTFAGTDYEVSAKADYFRRILKVEELEVFGYSKDHDMKDTIKFWDTLDFWNMLYFCEGSIFLGFFKTGLDQKIILTRQHWINFLKASIVSPALASVGLLYNFYVKYSVPATFLRQLFNYNNVGYLVHYKDSKLTSMEYFLGQDYFSQSYASP